MSAQVVLHARLDPGTAVTLVKTRGETQLRAEGGEEVDRRRANQQGSATFASGVEVGACYLAVGRLDRHPIEVRARGREAETAVAQPPVRPDRGRQVQAPPRMATAETSQSARRT
jgi:hypothetical protein